MHGRVYCTREHDSLKISNGKWMWWSRGFGGVSALDYLVKVKGLSFANAMEILCGKKDCVPSFFNAVKAKETPKKLLLPERNESNRHITGYLMGRGIARNIIESCIESGILFESKLHHSCIFLGKDDKDIPRYAAFRGCTEERILGEAAGSDKSYPFRLEAPDSPVLHLFESAIDLLSYATIRQSSGHKWNDETLLSMGGINVSKSGAIPISIRSFLENHGEIREIHIHFDSDMPGRSAAQSLKKTLEERYRVYDNPPPLGKDFNDYLKKLIEKERHDRRIYDGNNQCNLR